MENTASTLGDLLRDSRAKSLIWRTFLQRFSVAAFGTALVTIVAIQSEIFWFPNSNGESLSGLAVIGLVGTAGSIGSLISNSLGYSVMIKLGVHRSFILAGAITASIIAGVAIALLSNYFATIGIIGLCLIAFLMAAAGPGIAGLCRAWWELIRLPQELAARGGALEPALSAIAWSIGPAIAAPLAIWSPWTLAISGLGATVSLFAMASLPNVPLIPKIKKSSTKKSTRFIRNWWMAGTYSLYHAARGLLSVGSTALLVTAGQPSLIGLATAAPSIGHSFAGIIFAARADPLKGLRKAVFGGLLGQLLPTIAIAVVFIFWPEPGIIAAAGLLVGGGVVIGILKAPVAAAIYPLASQARPEVENFLSYSRMAQGMIIGGILGPLAGTLIVSTIGAPWLLPASALAILICAVGVALDPTIVKLFK